jgi:DNA-binding MarR family transcriptional regulator
MPALLGGGNYTTSQASYDLTRLRTKGLIERLPGRNVYHLTPTGQRFAVFYTKLHNRLLRPLMAADHPPAPLELRQALHTINRHIDNYLDLAGVCPA